MDRIRQVLATIAKYLGRLNATQKLLIGSLVVIALMSLFLVSQYAGRARLVELIPSVPAAEQGAKIRLLRGAGIKAEMRGTSLMVPADGEQSAIVHLSEANQLGGDKVLLFENLLDRQTWYLSRQQNEKLYTEALQNKLAQVIMGWSNIRSATVVLDVPEPNGLGAGVRQPTATVSATTRDGTPLSQSRVDAIAAWVAGSKAGLSTDRVRVIDGSPGGGQRKASSEQDVQSSSRLEHADRIETKTQEMLRELLSYIPGVVVAVTAEVDVTRVATTVQKNLPEEEGSVAIQKRKTNTSTDQSEAAPGAAPGVASNQKMDIARGGGAGGVKMAQSETTTENEVAIGQRTEQSVDPGGAITSVAVSVNVPRGYVAALLQQESAPASGGGAPAAPTQAQVEARFETEKTRIAESILPHLRTMMTQASKGLDAQAVADAARQQVAISLIPVDLPQVGAPVPAGVLGGGGGSFLALGSGVIDKILLGGLAVAAMALMVLMVRKAGRRMELPTPEELLGVPPTLDSKGDLIGEAEEGDTALAGIEVGEEAMATQKMLEQVTELVKQSPDSAAKLINRWMASQEA